MQKVVKQTGQLGVPQTDINGKWIIGYDPESIIEALNK
ncbi:glutaredoxin [Lederbergia galactosidilyticus]|nr:glutaredoxin [Lederbergia galactosidilytica]